jgi:hypothetical protein
MFRTILAIISSGVWIIISEAFRNQVLLKKFWVEQYNKIGFHVAEGLSSSSKLLFAAWVLILSVIIYILLKKFNAWETIIISWSGAFVLLWLILGTYNLFPPKILLYAILLSFVEVMVSAFIIKSIATLSLKT